MSRGYRGSKLHMQDAVVDRQAGLSAAIRDALPTLRGHRLRWVSPLATDDYAEFYDGAFLDALGLGEHREALRALRGPNWDALAVAEGPDAGVVLVEAKAHVGETPQPDRCWASSSRSRALIESSLTRARGHLGVSAALPSWTGHHYQVANRLAHVWWLHAERRVPTWLVFLGFTESPDWPDALTPEGWKIQVATALSSLGVPSGHPLSDRIGVEVMKA